MREVLPLLLLLSACAAEEAPAPSPEHDPASEQALNDQIMIDPDLANQNEGNAALTVPSDHSLPLPVATREAVASARAEAALLVGGSDKLAAPSEPRPLPHRLGGDLLTLEERAAGLKGAAACARQATRSAAWAARFPKELPVYPRAATQAAAGTDAKGCALRAVSFVTPVPLEDVLAFYATRARQGRFAFDHRAGGGAHRLSGRNAGAVFVIDLATGKDGLTRADLVVANL